MIQTIFLGTIQENIEVSLCNEEGTVYQALAGYTTVGAVILQE
jgi:hypothetical protein